MIPPWFGTYASIFTGLLAYEISRSVNAGVAATLIMAVIPAHLMRPVSESLRLSLHLFTWPRIEDVNSFLIHFNDMFNDILKYSVCEVSGR